MSGGERISGSLALELGRRGLSAINDGAARPKSNGAGSPVERDGAYHQGTVWPWLLGPFIDAYLIAFGRAPENLAHCHALVETLEAESANSGCLGSIAEIYDADEPRYPAGIHAVRAAGHDQQRRPVRAEYEAVRDRAELAAQLGGRGRRRRRALRQFPHLTWDVQVAEHGREPGEVD